MLIHGHLKLHWFRLKSLQGWDIPREGLFFLFPRAGEGEYVSNSSVQPLAGGDVLVLLGGVEAQIRASAGAELGFHAFSVGVEHLFPIFIADEIALVQTLLDGLKTARFHPGSNPATAAWHQLIREVAPDCDLEHRSQLLHVAASILSEEFKKLHPPLSRYERADGHVTRLFEQLSVDQILNLSVEEMAGRFGCSERHLNRLFNEHFGVSVGVLRMEMRLLKAVPLLQNPGLNIAHVAKQCGFNHLGLFNTCFKRRFGVSPGKWRKNAETGEEHAGGLATGKPRCRIRKFGLCPLSDTTGELAKSRPAPFSMKDASAGPLAAMSSALRSSNGPSEGLALAVHERPEC